MIIINELQQSCAMNYYDILISDTTSHLLIIRSCNLCLILKVSVQGFNHFFTKLRTGTDQDFLSFL